MGLDDLVNKAKDVIADRGGTDAAKADATEVKEDVSREGSLTDKVREVAEDLKDPGAPGN